MANWSQAIWILENLKKMLESQTTNILNNSTIPRVVIDTSISDPRVGDIRLISSTK